MVSNPVPMADSFSIAMWSWPSYKREASGQFQDVSRVPSRNFDCLSFTSLWSPSPFLQLVLEPIWSLVGFNGPCDPKATWRKVF
jgi:hypothetical protein